MLQRKPRRWLRAQARDTPVEVLDLTNNKMSAAAAEHVAEILRAQPLRELNLNLNELGGDGVGVLADAAAACATLETLDVGGNDVGPAGAKALMAALSAGKAKGKLQELQLECVAIIRPFFL